MAFYDFKKKPALTIQNEEKEVLYPGIVYSGKIESERLIHELAKRSTFNEGEIEGILTDLLNLTSNYLGEGYQVELGDFGVFSGKITSRMVEKPEDIQASSIYFNGVNFRPSIKFKRQISGDLYRSKYNKFQKSDLQISKEECERRLLKHLDEEGFINRSTYGRLTHRLKDMALNDLHGFVQQGIIEKRGRGNQLYFVRAKEEKTGREE